MATMISLDPGTTTGYVIGNPEDGFVTGQIGPEDHHHALYKLLKAFEPVVVICEAFTFRPNPGRRKIVLDSKEYIGVTRLYCEEYDIKYVEQQPSQAKGFWTDDKLKKAELWEPGKKHAMDALRHMLYYVTFAENDHTYIMKLKPGN